MDNITAHQLSPKQPSVGRSHLHEKRTTRKGILYIYHIYLFPQAAVFNSLSFGPLSVPHQGRYIRRCPNSFKCSPDVRSSNDHVHQSGCHKVSIKCRNQSCNYYPFIRNNNSVEGGWKWGEHKLPKVSSYTYLGIDFACNGA